jgi:Flp pilus assembly secretin CpaC
MRRIRAVAWMAALLGSTAIAGGQTLPPATVMVVLDQARVVPLPQNVATVVVGNPSIADASIQNGSLMVVTGRGFGLTNVMLLDKAGQTLSEHQVRVVAPRDETVTVFRGGERMTYACAPRCESVIVIGDSKDYFDNLKKQAEERDKMASGTATR